MLNFDEFRAVSNRDKAREAGAADRPKGNAVKRKAAKVVDDIAPTPSKVEEKEAPPPRSAISTISAVFQSVGEFLETHQMQAIYVFLIILDTFNAMADLYIGSRPSSDNVVSFITNHALLRAIRSFSTFTILFFIVEILSVLLVFRSKVLGHLGYVLDVLIILYQIFCDYSGASKISRMLNFLRFWRLFRFFSAMVLLEQEAHQETKTKLETVEAQVKALNLENFNARAECDKEKEARNAIESMLQSYKDEVDTLNEALKIAAMDIAEVAQGDEMPYDFDEDEEEEEEGLGDDASASQGGGGAAGGTLVSASTGGGSQQGGKKGSNKAAIMSSVMASGGGAGGGSASASAAAAAAFLVHEDGTFHRK